VTAPSTFTLGYVPGVTPAKWVRTWQERVPDVPLDLVQVSAAAAAALVRDGAADAVLLRLPADRDGLHAIPLYTETTVVVFPKDHHLAAADEVSTEDIGDSLVLHPHDDTLDWPAPPGELADHRPDTTQDAVELVAAGVGLLVVPQSLARLHHRKDLTYRPLTDVPQSRVALSWPADETSDLMEQFIGIVRGRTVNSTRGRAPEPVATRQQAPARKPPKAKAATENRRRQTRKPRRRS
jgi:DNA-binding transcriptional LysR family regulator